MKLGIIRFFSAYILLAPFFHIVSVDTSFTDASNTEMDSELEPVPAPEPIPDPVQESSMQLPDQGNQAQTAADNQQAVPTSDQALVPSSSSDPASDQGQESSTQLPDQGNEAQTAVDNQRSVLTSDQKPVSSSSSDPGPDQGQDSPMQTHDQGNEAQTAVDNQRSVPTSDQAPVTSSSSHPATVPAPDQGQESPTQPQDQGSQSQTAAYDQHSAPISDPTTVSSSSESTPASEAAPETAPVQAHESSTQFQAIENQTQNIQNQELPSQEKTKLAIEPDKQQPAVDQQRSDGERDQPSYSKHKNVSTSQRAPDSKISAMEDQEAYQARAIEEVQRRKQLQTEAAKQKLFVAKHKKIEAQRLEKDAMERQENDRKLTIEDVQLNKDKSALRKIPKDSKSQDVSEAQNSAANNNQKKEQGQDTPGTAEERDLEQEIARNEEKLAMLRLKLKNKQGHVKTADDQNSSYKAMHSLSSLDEHGNIVQNVDSKPGIEADNNLATKNTSQSSQNQLVGKQQKHTNGKENPKTQYSF